MSKAPTMREMIDRVNEPISTENLSEVDMGQYLSAQDREDARLSRLARPSFYTPEEEKEVRALRSNPNFWDDTEEGLALVARLHEIKANANERAKRGG